MDFDIAATVKLCSFIGTGLCIGLGAMGPALGVGYTAGQADKAIAENPSKYGDIFKNMLVGQAMAESAAIFALVVGLLLIFLNFPAATMLKAVALIGAGVCMGAGAIGSGIGSGYPAGGACLGMARRPELTSRFTMVMLVGSAVCQTPAIFALVLSMMLLFVDFGHAPVSPTWAALLGAGLCMGFGAIGSGLGSGFAGREACTGIAKQPAISGRLTTTMLIGSAVCQTPAIFSMVVALMLLFLDFGGAPASPTWAALLGGGIATGVAAIGSGMGGGMAAGASCEGIARNPETFGQVTTTMLIGQAVTQTPSIFGLLVSFILIFKAYPEALTVAPAMALLGAGLCMGFGGIGPGIGNGMAAQGAVTWVARNVEATGVLLRTMLVAQAVSQSTAIYAMVISLVLIFVV